MELIFEEKTVIKTLVIPIKTGRCNIKFLLRYPFFPENEELSRFYGNINELFINGVCKELSDHNTTDIEEIEEGTQKTKKGETRLRANRLEREEKQHRCNIYSIDVVSSFEITKNSEEILSLYTDYIITSKKSILMYKRVSQTWVPNPQTSNTPSEETDASCKDRQIIMLDAKHIKDYFPKNNQKRTDYDGFYIEETNKENSIRFFKILPPPTGACRIKKKDYSSHFIKFV